MNRALAIVIILNFFGANTGRADDTAWLMPAFYSFEGREREASFTGIFRTEFRTLSEFAALTDEQKNSIARSQIEPTLQFLFGPLVNRSLGSPQRGTDIKVDWQSAVLVRGRVHLSYTYHGIWIVDKLIGEQFSIPVPLNRGALLTSRWKNCTDSAPEHQTADFYWYFWDPDRTGCDHREGVEYQVVQVSLGAETKNQSASFPEYPRLLKSTGVDNRFQLTFGFGYVKDPVDPNPDHDLEAGAYEYQSFVRSVKASEAGFQESAIYQREYRGGRQPMKIIGHRFVGKLPGADVVINVVMAAGVDQMEIFAKSFAHDHDGFFGWFGHSRVGSGFDAQRFGQLVAFSPEYYSVTPNYQLVYWGGCNSYSYYTLPFFDFKAQAANGADPNGTKGLDIVANGLPSYFSLNADNAGIVLKHLLNWPARSSYQTIINELEERARRTGINVLVAVLGDEDNP